MSFCYFYTILKSGMKDNEKIILWLNYSLWSNCKLKVLTGIAVYSYVGTYYVFSKNCTYKL